MQLKRLKSFQRINFEHKNLGRKAKSCAGFALKNKKRPPRFFVFILSILPYIKLPSENAGSRRGAVL
jgi:hypothetical protein